MPRDQHDDARPAEPEVSPQREGRVELLLLDTVGYRAAWSLQESLHAERRSGRRGDTLVLLDHLPVITLGRSGGLEFLHDATGPLLHPAVGPIELVHTDRGGKCTYHGPGQLVGYGIVALEGRGFTAPGWVHFLEQVLVRVLAELGLAANTLPGRVGVWVDDRKLASIGVRVRDGIALHGFALNVENELGPFGLMDPCGLSGVRMTSTRAEGLDATLDDVRGVTARIWRSALEGRRARRREPEPVAVDDDVPEESYEGE